MYYIIKIMYNVPSVYMYTVIHMYSHTYIYINIFFTHITSSSSPSWRLKPGHGLPWTELWAVAVLPELL